MNLAIIGGTGLYRVDWLENRKELTVATRYGRAQLVQGTYAGNQVYFLNRHGVGHALPPHRVNYRANIWALQELGVQRIIATAAVGSLQETIHPGSWVLIDQFIDFTKSRPMTFYEGDGQGVVHVDVSNPYCPDLRHRLADHCRSLNIPFHDKGTYVCTEGPRFETPAEIRMFAQWGGDVVGMTGVPEIVLSREVGLCYAALAMVTNYAAGISATRLTHSEVVAVMNQNGERLSSFLQQVIASLGNEANCDCHVLPEVHGR